MKFEAAQQATRKDRHPIRAVNESDTSNSSVERLERQMRSFLNRVESLMSQKADGRRPLNAGPAVEKGICREAAGHAKALKLIAPPRRRSQCVYHSNDLAQKLKEKLIWTPPRVVLQTVTGKKIDIHGKLKVKIKFGDATYQHAVYVADIADPFILGLDFLKEHGFTLDFNKNELRSIHEEVTIFKIEHRSEPIRQKSSAERLFQEFEDVFSRNSSDIGHTTVTQHRIDTADHPPIKQHPRRLPFAKQEEVGTLLREMQENDIIEPSSSPWASPIVLVRKKDGSTRFCVDYRKLNDVTKKDSYPLPRIDDTLDTLSGHKWFSTLDLKSGYWQVEIHPEDSLIYLDDVIIGGRTFEEHLQNIRKVLSKLSDANLKLNPSKCKFFQKEVNYLGHIISAEGVRTDPEKVSAVKNWKRPENLRELRSFLGLCTYYRKFVKGFSNIARPLHKLTESKQKFQWTKECEDSFLQLKEALTSSPILIYPQPDKPFILDTDASNESVGAVLSQEIDGQEQS
ncbi:retrovirus-related Pol polyprotein from transposon 412 [Trichonephila clavipes]|uniref:RNA-directed DNA polymerase n=1 Tax=Trichonephila clavipes TaxID=2585209 RepID=A0A8X6T091_TRICX|nr:retrovirus-related Pol polyprotein from transposon 412 [Trichonephila clavipes]